MARLVGDPMMVWVNGKRLDVGSFTVTYDADLISVHWSETDRPLRPGDEGYDPDYDPELDKLGWDADDFSPNACAPEMAASPYAASDRSREAQAWRTAAIREESWKRETEGRYGAFTDEEMEEARALARQETRPDPVEEILGHAADWTEGDEPETEPWLAPSVWASALPTVTFTVDTSGFRASMAKVQAVFADTNDRIKWAKANPSPYISWPIIDEAKHLYGIDARNPKPAVDRIRHGAASVCPQHGETRGGTCMKCARRRGR